MPQPETALTKYVFLDIEGFTKGRSVEAQADVINALNSIVWDVLGPYNIHESDRLLLPTGDGICIALLNQSSYDVHLDIALKIIAGVHDYNYRQMSDAKRQFQVRIGINENIDNLVTDINGRPNVAGNGINMAQRIMSLADGNQILIGQGVYEILSGREKYMSGLNRLSGTDKHGNRFPVYQYVSTAHSGLNTDIPSTLKPRGVEEKKLSMLAAYYLAHAIENKNFLLRKKTETLFCYVAPVLLYFKASDSVSKSEASQYDNPTTMTYQAAGKDEEYEYYEKIDFWVLCQLAEFITESVLQPFRAGFVSSQWAFVNQSGVEKLRNDWPDIFVEFSFSPDALQAE